jgi:plastocyanin
MLTKDRKFMRFGSACLACGLMSLVSVSAHAAETVTMVGGGDGSPFRYEPATVTVKSGDKITWVNKTAAEHSVTPDPGYQKRLKSKDVHEEQSYSTVIKGKSGPIKYHCKYHPQMKATIVVSAQ